MFRGWSAFICFEDYNKAFDEVRLDHEITLLEKKNLGQSEIHIISNIYNNQTAIVRIENDISDQIEIKRGVRQGCVLSLLLSNM